MEVIAIPNHTLHKVFRGLQKKEMLVLVVFFLWCDDFNEQGHDIASETGVTLCHKLIELPSDWSLTYIGLLLPKIRLLTAVFTPSISIDAIVDT